MGYTESYTYDYLGNMLSKTDKNGNTVTFEYNTFGLASKTDGETEIVNTYNGIGQLVSANTVGQNQTSYTYDPFGNVATVTQGDSLQSYTYDDNCNVTGYTLSIGGEQKSSETYTYNNMNRLIGQNVNGKDFTFAYDLNGNLTARTIDGVTEESYTYNKAGLSVTKTGANGTYVNEYRPDGFKIKETAGTFEKAFVYDDFGRLVTDSYTNGEDVIYSNTYTYDSRGNRLTMSDGTVTTNYTYDLNNRLVSKNKVTEGVETERISLFYDFNGNTISQRTLTHGTTAEMSVGVLGEGTDTGIKLFEYDGFNRLTKYTDDNSVASYTYYADNLRAGKTVNGAEKQFYWNGSNLAGEANGTGVKTYSYDLLGVSAVNDGTATTYFDKDTHSDIVAHLNGEGEITSSQYFDSFGNKNSQITEDEFGYTGEYMDAESGLIYLRNRYYDPETGRFINEDPVRDGVNWYVYCNGNPVMFVDPWGLVVTEWDELVCSKKDLKKLHENSKLWESGNEKEKQKAAEASRKIREKYLKDNETLLDNGYVQAVYTDSYTVSDSTKTIKINTEITYDRIYGENTYIQLTGVNVSANVGSGCSIISMEISLGQVTGFKGVSKEDKIYGSKYSYKPKWGMVLDDRGAGSTTVGLYIYVDASIRNKSTQIIIQNQVYEKSNTINGEVNVEPPDLSQVMIEALQRGER